MLVWDGSGPHEVENVGDGPARTLIVATAPSGVTVSDGDGAPGGEGRDQG